VTFDSDQNAPGYILAPLAVSPDHQNLRVGTSLVEEGIRKISKTGSRILFVYGDPQYYKRFGFQREIADGFIPPYKLQYPSGWQAMIINGARTDVPPGKIACVASLRHPELW
jgi:putative acetyltransferase